MIVAPYNGSYVPTKVERRIGHHGGKQHGPLVIYIGGVHGNEPSGVIALQNVFTALSKSDKPFLGDAYGLAGNIPALRKGTRYIDKDLNRIWEGHIKSNEGIAEEKEQNELLVEISSILEKHNETPFFLDLHSTSSESVPFMAIGDTLRNRAIIDEIPAPLVLGLEEEMDGTLFRFFSSVGVAAALFEAGEHHAWSTVENQEAFIWLTLEKLGCITKEDYPQLHKFRTTLSKGISFERRIFELRSRFNIPKDKEFKMQPGYANFQPVKIGEHLADCDGVEVKASEKGRIFMPLYQKKGRDGFFVVRSINPFWLRVSEKTRRLNLDGLLLLLPGVRRNQDMRNSYLVRTVLYKMGISKVFHLMGYRRVTEVNGHYIFSRREYDLQGPDLEEIRYNVTEYLQPKKSKIQP